MRHVLVIDDEYLIRQYLADLAVVVGASSVAMAESEQAAVEAARYHRPTVIVSDVDLKEGGRGPDAVARITEMCGTVPAIFVTGNPEDPGVWERASAVIPKPCTAAQFARTFSVVAATLPPWRDTLPVPMDM